MILRVRVPLPLIKQPTNIWTDVTDAAYYVVTGVTTINHATETDVSDEIYGTHATDENDVTDVTTETAETYKPDETYSM